MARALAVLLATFLFVAPAAAQPAGRPSMADPTVKAEGLTKVSRHVWVIPDRNAGGVPNVGIVVGSRAALVIDTGLGRRNGEIVLAAALKVAGDRKLYLAATHFHPEHDLGAQAFPPGTILIRSEDQVKDVAEFGPGMMRIFAGFSPATAALLEGAAYRPADLTFAGEHRLDLGGVVVRVLAMGPDHTRGDTAFWVEGDRVLFSGDVAMKGPPSLTSPHSSVTNWLQSLDRLEALKPAMIVPSHGPTGGVELIAGYRAYFTAVREGVAAAKARGETADQAAASVAAELKPRWPAYPALPAARAAYGEIR